MSQEKVDRYKEQKANRKEIMAQQKKKRMIRNTVTGIVAAIFVGWVGYSGYISLTTKSADTATPVDYKAVVEYINGLVEAE